MPGAVGDGWLEIAHVPGEGQDTLVIQGTLDFTSANTLRDRIEALCRESDRIVLDLSGVEFIDSTGLAQLVWAHSEAREHDWSLAIQRPSERVQGYLKRTGLDRVLPVA